MPTASLTSEQISIHAPRMGSDFFIRDISINEFAFQSTLPAWGATFLNMLKE